MEFYYRTSKIPDFKLIDDIWKFRLEVSLSHCNFYPYLFTQLYDSFSFKSLRFYAFVCFQVHDIQWEVVLVHEDGTSVSRTDRFRKKSRGKIPFKTEMTGSRGRTSWTGESLTMWFQTFTRRVSLGFHGTKIAKIMSPKRQQDGP